MLKDTPLGNVKTKDEKISLNKSIRKRQIRGLFIFIVMRLVLPFHTDNTF